MWFRQDLRLHDLPALAGAAKTGQVLPLYILDDETPGEWRWGGASRWWLHHSLSNLQAAVPFILRRGRADQVIADILEHSGATALHFTRDYAPWSAALEQRIKNLCDQRNIACHRHSGFLLHEPEAIRNGQGEPYKVYTPFSRACFASGEPRSPQPATQVQWAKNNVQSDKLADWKLLPTKPDWAHEITATWRPGEAAAKKALADFIADALDDYAEGRDRPDKQLTSVLSPHLHWGEISPHQVWHAVRAAMAQANGSIDNAGEKFLKEILWREFCAHLVYQYPTFPSEPFRPEFAAMPWRNDNDALHRWQRGQTGYPIVDAGMRQLWATGIMHNRVRMIVASFLIKHLLIAWQDGEKWFWDCLVDADISANAANWQWVAGCGADAAPYYRIFNPMLQGAKFDPQGDYVKRWVPELAHLGPEHIHTPWDMDDPPKDYPPPIVNHNAARDRAMAAFQTIKKGNE